MPMHRLSTLVLGLFTATALSLGIAACGGKSSAPEADPPLSFSFVEGDASSDNYLLEISVSGPILNRSSGSGWFALEGGITYGYNLQRLLQRVAKDDRVQGIFLRMATPGGTVVGSDVIYEALVNYKEETGNPILAYVEGISASGGVWVMVAADEIHAAPGSIVGSIGVRGPSWFFFDDPVAIDGGLLGGGITTRNGIQRFGVSAGQGKDLGNPFRTPTPGELDILQRGIDNEYDRFVTHVEATRGIPATQIREELGAYIFDTQQAQEYGLIDAVTGRPDAIATLAEKAELPEDDYRLVRIASRSPGLLTVLLGQWGLSTPDSTPEQLQATQQRDLCELNTHSILVYYGDVLALCSTPEMNRPEQ